MIYSKKYLVLRCIARLLPYVFGASLVGPLYCFTCLLPLIFIKSSYIFHLPFEYSLFPKKYCGNTLLFFYLTGMRRVFYNKVRQLVLLYNICCHARPSRTHRLIFRPASTLFDRTVIKRSSAVISIRIQCLPFRPPPIGTERLSHCVISSASRYPR